ncbi:MAG: transporter [Planctomycetaceae bacterium]|nr:transporter [Planctomycetaceae bacterium]
MAHVAEVPSSLSALARWRIVLLLMGFAAIGHFNRVGIAVAGSEIFIPKLGITETRMGWVYTAFLIVYTLGMVPGGWLIDRFGSARVMTWYGLTMGTFVALTGMLGWVTTTPANLWLGLLVIRGLAGLCSAPLHPGAAHVVSDLIVDRRRATANGLVNAGALFGIACCYPVFGWLMDRLNWPLAFIVSGTSLIVYGILWHSIASSSLPAPTNKSAVTDQLDLRAAWSLLSQANLWLLTLSYAAYSYLQYLFFYWMGYYFEKVLHVPDIESRRASFYIMLAMGAGMAIGGLSTDAVCKKLGTIRGRRSIVMSGMVLGSLFALLGVNVEGQRNVAICLAISMAALGICEGVFWTTATDIGGKLRGFSGAFMNAGGNVGGLISPVLTPMMAEQIGWPASITVACVISGLGGLVWFAIKPQGDRLTYGSVQ